MSILIIIFGILIFLSGIVLFVKPEIIFKILRENYEELWLHVGAVVVRLLLGALLIRQSSVSKFPVTTEVIGWVSICSAIIFTLIGRKNFQQLISWAISLAKTQGRIGGLLALIFGFFLVYAFV